MRVVEETQMIAKKEVAFVCSKCKTQHDRVDVFECQEMVSFSDVGGYGSIIGDGVEWRIDLCQKCFYELCGDYLEISE